MKLLPNILYLFVFFIVTGCDERPLTPAEQARERNEILDKPFLMGGLPADNSPYSVGFRDGCNSALATVSIGYVKTSREQIYLDYNRKITDQQYHKGWNTGHNYCTYYLDVDPL